MTLLEPEAVRLRLRERGHSPIPVNGKRPLIEGWQKLAGATAADIAAWSASKSDHANTGALTALMPTFDVDIKDQAAADAVEQLVRDRFGDCGKVLVRVGNAPNRAIFFQTAKTFNKLAVNLVAPNGDTDQKLELLCDGQQVVVDGIHPDTHRPYCWSGGDLTDVSRYDLPPLNEAEARLLLQDAVELLSTEHGYTLAPTRPKANGADHLDAAGGGADDWSFLTANILAGSELHDSIVSLSAKFIAGGMKAGAVVNLIRGLMQQSAAPRDERWQARYDDISRIVDSAWNKYHGDDDDLAIALRVVGSTFTANALTAMMFDQIKFIVKDFIAEGLTLFAGKPKIGKSWLLLHIAHEVAIGGYTLGGLSCEQGDVLYCALEDNQRRLQRRMTKLFDIEAWPSNLTFACEMPRLANGGIKFIKDWIEKAQRPRLVIIDTLAMVRSPARKDQSSYDADYAAVKELRDLAAEHGIAIIIVHHLRKADADDPFDTVSGTLGLTGCPDSIMIIWREGNGVLLAAKGRDIEEVKKSVQFDAGSCTWNVIGDADAVRRSVERSAIIKAFEEANGEPLGPRQIAEAAGMKAGNVRQLMMKMKNEGIIKVSSYGKYVLSKGSGVDEA
jgi:hypothetical protein